MKIKDQVSENLNLEEITDPVMNKFVPKTCVNTFSFWEKEILKQGNRKHRRIAESQIRHQLAKKG